MTSQFWGWLGMNSQFVVVLCGLPVQARRLHKTKSPGSMSLWYFIFCFWTSFCYFNHGMFEAHSVYIYAPQIPGMFFGGIVIWLIIYYRHFYPRRVPAVVRASS